MCVGPEKSETTTSSSPSSSCSEEVKPVTKNMNHLTVETEDSFSSLLELAANNDVDAFKRSVERDISAIDEIGLWYGRQKGSKQMVLEHRTPLMVAATYGSVDVLKIIIGLSEADVNLSCGPDKSTALHCAASGGSLHAVDVVKLLLVSGADPNCVDSNGRCAADVIVVSPKLPDMKAALEELLTNNGSFGSSGEHNLRIVTASSNSNSPPLSSSPENGSPSSASDSTSSPMTNGISHSSMAWPQPNVPTLHLPGSNLQSSRLRSSLNARDIQADDFSLLAEFEAQQQHQHQQLLNELSCFSQPRLIPTSANRPIRTKSLAPSNLEDLFSAEMSSSPRYSDQAMSSSMFSPSHKSAVLNQFQQQQSMLSPINTNVFSPKNVDHPLLQASFGGLHSPGRMSPRSMEPISPMSSRAVFSQREKLQQHSLSSRDLGSNMSGLVGSPVNSWSKWGSPNGKLDWAVHGDELGPQRKTTSFETGNNGGDEPDLSWVQSLVKESPPEIKEKPVVPTSAVTPPGENSNSKAQIESLDHAVLGAWLEQMQLDQLVA
ncbi:hypothetical protein IFM89_024449 [Coptis chinensis]|uniref:Uncharacterized protein n=1 Tax=Coptis chinensis TaxID=261450 RepID=A0A835LNQ5_9MAGN|nr:hypothetical protein IFM89_024449 [Coptis chinensis]